MFILINHAGMNLSNIILILTVTALTILLSVIRFRQTLALLILHRQSRKTQELALIEQEKLRISLEKHKIIMEQTNDILFEWNIEEDKVTFSQNWNQFFEYPSVIPDFQNWVIRQSALNQPSKKAILEAMYQCRTGTAYTEQEFSLFYPPSRQMEWFQMRVSIQFDSCSRPMTGIGVLVNIHNQKTEIQQLRSMAQTDSLTGLLNKSAMENLVRDCLLHADRKQLMAMLILDLDNFKNINDTYGHPCGDYVIAQTAQCMRKIFSDTESLGRIGGDEFSVFLPEAGDRTDLEKKAGLLLESVRNIRWNGSNPGAGCSIGIAVTASPETTYEELYRQTDNALYQAKQMGKNCFVFSCNH